jgi:membrane-bound lytic murein transglycosylase D
MPERFGLALDDLPNQPVFQQVALSHPMEAKAAARLAEMDLDTFLALNPAFKRRVIYSDTQHTLLLPVDKVEPFRANLEQTEGKHARLQPYKGRKGEALASIAARFDVTVQWIKEHNPLNLQRGRLAQAQTLLLPGRSGVARAAVPRPKARTAALARPAEAPLAGPVVANAAALPPSQIQATGPAQAPESVAKVARLEPELSPPAFETGAILRGHLVRRGETLLSLAQRYKVSVADIREHNRAMRSLRPGDIVLIPITS